MGAALAAPFRLVMAWLLRLRARLLARVGSLETRALAELPDQSADRRRSEVDGVDGDPLVFGVDELHEAKLRRKAHRQEPVGLDAEPGEEPPIGDGRHEKRQNAGANLLLDTEARSAIGEQGRTLVILNYAALSLAVVICLWGSARIARRVETLHEVTSLDVRATAKFREIVIQLFFIPPSRAE